MDNQEGWAEKVDPEVQDNRGAQAQELCWVECSDQQISHLQDRSSLLMPLESRFRSISSHEVWEYQPVSQTSLLRSSSFYLQFWSVHSCYLFLMSLHFHF